MNHQCHFVRHSPPGMPYGFVRIIIFYLFFILPPPRFLDDNFWPPSRTVPEFWPVTVHGHRKKCVVFRHRATPGWGRLGRPKHPKMPPPKCFFFAFQNPRNIFCEKLKFQLIKTSTRPRPKFYTRNAKYPVSEEFIIGGLSVTGKNSGTVRLGGQKLSSGNLAGGRIKNKKEKNKNKILTKP